MPGFTVEFTDEALESLAFLRKHDQALVLDTMERQLAAHPLVETRNQKPLRPNELSQWELRVRHLRVFYNVDAETATVTVVAVGWKEHNRYYIRGREFRL